MFAQTDSTLATNVVVLEFITSAELGAGFDKSGETVRLIAGLVARINHELVLMQRDGASSIKDLIGVES